MASYENNSLPNDQQRFNPGTRSEPSKQPNNSTDAHVQPGTRSEPSNRPNQPGHPIRKRDKAKQVTKKVLKKVFRYSGEVDLGVAATSIATAGVSQFTGDDENSQEGNSSAVTSQGEASNPNPNPYSYPSQDPYLNEDPDENEYEDHDENEYEE